MVEGLCAEITAVVDRHLRAARDLLDSMLVRLNRAPAANDPEKVGRPHINGVVASKEATSTAPRQRGRRRVTRQHQTTLAPEPQIAGDREAAPPWSELRLRIRDRIRESGSSYAAVADIVGCARSTLETWCSKNSPPPSQKAVTRLRQWLKLPEPVAETDDDSQAPWRLTDPERDRLNGHLSLSDERTLRATFGATRPLLEKAAAGARVNDEVVARVRAVLVGNGTAAAE